MQPLDVEALMAWFKKVNSFLDFDDEGNLRQRDPETLAKAQAETLATHRPALIGTVTEYPSNSYLGGRPILPKHLAWPTYDDRPMVFVCQIDLSALPRASEFDWLPRTGIIFYFVGQVGYEHIDDHIFQVIYSNEASNEERVNPPDGVEPQKRENLTFEIRDTYKLCSNEVVQSQDNNDLWDWEYKINPARQRSTRWQIGGWVSDLQNNENMPRDCERKYRNLEWNDFATVDRLFSSSVSKWRFIGCVDREIVDGEAGGAGYMRGYFWIKDTEASSGDFSRTAFLVQSD